MEDIKILFKQIIENQNVINEKIDKIAITAFTNQQNINNLIFANNSISNSIQQIKNKFSDLEILIQNINESNNDFQVQELMAQFTELKEEFEQWKFYDNL